MFGRFRRTHEQEFIVTDRRIRWTTEDGEMVSAMLKSIGHIERYQVNDNRTAVRKPSRGYVCVLPEGLVNEDEVVA